MQYSPPPNPVVLKDNNIVNKEEQCSTISSICFVECHRFLIPVILIGNGVRKSILILHLCFILPAIKYDQQLSQIFFRFLTKQRALLSICKAMFSCSPFPNPVIFNDNSIVNKEEQCSCISSTCFVECHRFLIQVLPRHAKHCRGRAMQNMAI